MPYCTVENAMFYQMILSYLPSKFIDTVTLAATRFDRVTSVHASNCAMLLASSNTNQSKFPLSSIAI
jgi:hypothetical protein